MLHRDKFTTSSLIRQGLLPCAPWSPTTAITARALEMFRVARLRCPTLSVHAWTKGLCDLHGLPFRAYLGQQVSICYDLYLQILQTVDSRVNKALGRDAPDWRLKNCCPACTYKLEGEAKMIYSILIPVDGNNSLKRVLRKEPGVLDENGNPKHGTGERFDPRTESAGGDYFRTREEVDLWSKEVLSTLITAPVSILLNAFTLANNYLEDK